MPQTYVVQTNYGPREVNADSAQQAQTLVAAGGAQVQGVASGGSVAAPTNYISPFGTQKSTALSPFFVPPAQTETARGYTVGGQLPTGASVPQQQTLIDIYQSRPDVQSTLAKAFPGQNPLQEGTKANTWLNDWWNRIRTTEYPGITLKQPISWFQQQTANAQKAVDNLPIGVDITKGAGQEIRQNGPTLPFDISNIDAIAAGIKNATPTQDMLLAEMKRIQGEQTTQASSLKALMGAAPTPLSADELTKKAFESLGLPSNFTKTQFQSMQATSAEIATLTQNMNAVATRELTALSNAEGQAIPMENISNQQAQIKRNFAIEKSGIAADITAKAAYLQALQGNFTLVTSLVDKAVTLAFQTNAQKISDYRWMFDNYKDEFNKLSTREQHLFDTLVQTVENETNARKEDLKDKIHLYLNAGLAIPDIETLKNQTLAEVATFISKNAGVKSSDTEIVEANGRKLLINSKTGTVIKDIGAVLARPTNASRDTFINPQTIQSIPGLKTTFTPSEQTFLHTLPFEDISAAQGVANYDFDPVKVSSLRSNKREKIIAAAKIYNPKFNMADYPAKAQLKKSFTSGPYSNAIVSMNTVVGHLATLSSAADAMKNGNLIFANVVKNGFLRLTGDPRVNNFSIAVQAVGAELGRVFRGTGQQSEKEIEQWQKSFDVNSSPRQVKAAINKAEELLTSRLKATNSTYNTAFGRDFPTLTQGSVMTLRSLGIEPPEEALRALENNPIDIMGNQTNNQSNLTDKQAYQEYLTILGQ